MKNLVLISAILIIFLSTSTFAWFGDCWFGLDKACVFQKQFIKELENLDQQLGNSNSTSTATKIDATDSKYTKLWSLYTARLYMVTNLNSNLGVWLFKQFVKGGEVYQCASVLMNEVYSIENSNFTRAFSQDKIIKRFELYNQKVYNAAQQYAREGVQQAQELINYANECKKALNDFLSIGNETKLILSQHVADQVGKITTEKLGSSIVPTPINAAPASTVVSKHRKHFKRIVVDSLIEHIKEAKKTKKQKPGVFRKFLNNFKNRRQNLPSKKNNLFQKIDKKMKIDKKSKEKHWKEDLEDLEKELDKM